MGQTDELGSHRTESGLGIKKFFCGSCLLRWRMPGTKNGYLAHVAGFGVDADFRLIS